MKNKVENVRYYLKKSGLNSSNVEILDCIQKNQDLSPKELADLLIAQNATSLVKDEEGMVHQSSDRTANPSNLATIEKTETLVAKAAQKLDLTLTRDEVKDLADEFTDGYSVAVEDGDHVLKLLKNWILHQEKIAAIQLARLQDELEDVVTSSHKRIHKQVKGLLINTKERQRDYITRHKQEMESIYHFFGELMPDGNL